MPSQLQFFENDTKKIKSLIFPLQRSQNEYDPLHLKRVIFKYDLEILPRKAFSLMFGDKLELSYTPL